MKRCPKCKRFGVEFDPYTGVEKCLWKDCLWANSNQVNIEAEKFEINFKRFRKSLQERMGAVV